MWWLVTVLCFGSVENLLENDFMGDNFIKIEHFVYWPNATIPFYIDPEHFDHEQSNTILMALTNFAFKTCLKFLPALVRPSGDQHVLLLQNPDGVRQCVYSTTGHARDEPHKVVLGYDCLRPPKINMMLMRALGFGFEHNRAIRDLYVSVQKENIDPSGMDLFTMDDKLPLELRALPYDVNSVMHFDEREFSKNGHRTIVILDHKMKQNRGCLSNVDVRKINIVYGPECRKRDRQEKIDICQGFPGVARRKRSLDQLEGPVRRKRDVDPSQRKSLRVNPDITPPPEIVNNSTKDVQTIIQELGIEEGVEKITDLVYKVGALALNNTRKKYCNNTENATDVTTTQLSRRSDDKKPDILGIVETVADFVQDMVDHALSNLTSFCESETDFKQYQRARCPFYAGSGLSGTCWGNYKSTKTGNVMYSTKHRPYIVQSTKHVGGSAKKILYHQDSVRRRNDGETTKMAQASEVRKKRDVGETSREGEIRFEGRRYNVRKPHGTWEDSGVTMEKHKRKKKRVTEKEKSAENEEDTKEESKEQRPEQEEAEPKRANGMVPKTVQLSKKNREFYGERKWPDGVVRYIITKDESFDLSDLRRRLAAVNRILREQTCVKLEEITEEDAERFEDYLVLDASADYITGKVGGRQNFGSLELFEGGQHKQHTAMMVMAMLGFYFELARHDRDAHVRVHMRHVRADKLHHFEKIRSDATLPLPYDYDSATHPAWQFWRKLGRTGISTVATYKEKDPDGSVMRSLGQHDQLLSDTDIIKINSVYGVKCFTDPQKVEKEEDNIEKDLEEALAKHKNKNVHRDKDTEDREHVKHDDDSENDDRHKGRDDMDEDNHGRQKDRHRNKQGRDKDERDRRERDKHRKPHDSDEDREEMERIGDDGKGNRVRPDRVSKEQSKIGDHLPTNQRDWDIEDKSDKNDDKADYKDYEVRPGVVVKHGGLKGRGRHKKDGREEVRPHERDDYGKKHGEERYVSNRYKIKERDERDRQRNRERKRDRNSFEEEGRGRDRHRDRRDRDRDERGSRNKHRPRDEERREEGFVRRPSREGPKEHAADGGSNERQKHNAGDRGSNEKHIARNRRTKERQRHNAEDGGSNERQRYDAGDGGSKERQRYGSKEKRNSGRLIYAASKERHSPDHTRNRDSKDSSLSHHVASDPKSSESQNKWKAGERPTVASGALQRRSPDFRRTPDLTRTSYRRADGENLRRIEVQ